MGVPICTCDKQTGNLVKESSFECFGKNIQINNENRIIIKGNSIVQNKNSDNESYELKDIERIKYKKMVNENGNSSLSKIKQVLSSTISCNNNSTQFLSEEKNKNIIKIQSLFRAYLVRKKLETNSSISNNDSIEEKIEEEECISFIMNISVTESVFSSKSLNSSKILGDKHPRNSFKNIDINNKDSEIILFPFNIKNKMKMKYKYSGYVLKKNRNKKEKEKVYENSSSFSEEKKIISNKEDKHGLIKEGFGKFIFNDGTEFYGIFHQNKLKNYGKYTSINHKEKNDQKVIVNNKNYEEFMGEYNNYVPDGFGIYKNFFTNLKVQGIFKGNYISGIGIEDSVEGNYLYYGEFINNKKEGYGTIEWKDGSKYQGEFKDNQINGYGMIKFPNNKFYQGEVKNARMEGFGEFFWNDEKRYIGNYKNDKRNGFGIYIFKDDKPQSLINNKENKRSSLLDNFCAYIGFWKNGNMDGFGIIVNRQEIKYGLWENNTNRRFFETDFSIRTYLKWIEKKYYNFFLWKHKEFINFLEQCIIIKKEINPIEYDVMLELKYRFWKIN